MIFLKFFLLFWYLCFIFFLPVLSEAELTDDRLMNECSNLRIFWYYIKNNNLSCYFQTFTFRLFLLKITALAYSTYSTTSEKKNKNFIWWILSVVLLFLLRNQSSVCYKSDNLQTEQNIYFQAGPNYYPIQYWPDNTIITIFSINEWQCQNATILFSKFPLFSACLLF